MNVQQLLSDLGDFMGLADLSLDEDGACQLVFDDITNIDFNHDDQGEGSLIMHTVVGTVPPERKKETCITLLAGNYLGLETNGATLAIEPATSEIVLSTRMSGSHHDADSLSEVLTSFVRTARDWASRLNSSHGGSNDSMDPMPNDMIRV